MDNYNNRHLHLQHHHAILNRNHFHIYLMISQICCEYSSNVPKMKSFFCSVDKRSQYFYHLRYLKIRSHHLHCLPAFRCTDVIFRGSGFYNYSVHFKSLHAVMLPDYRESNPPGIVSCQRKMSGSYCPFLLVSGSPCIPPVTHPGKVQRHPTHRP